MIVWFIIFCIGMLIMSLGSIGGALWDSGSAMLLSLIVGVLVSVVALIGMVFILDREGDSFQEECKRSGGEVVQTFSHFVPGGKGVMVPIYDKRCDL